MFLGSESGLFISCLFIFVTASRSVWLKHSVTQVCSPRSSLNQSFYVPMNYLVFWMLHLSILVTTSFLISWELWFKSCISTNWSFNIQSSLIVSGTSYPSKLKLWSLFFIRGFPGGSSKRKKENLPAMQEMWVDRGGNALEEMAKAHSIFCANPKDARRSLVATIHGDISQTWL